MSEAAAGPWQTGEPPREGRYLIEYRQGRVQRPFIGDWIPYESRWSSLPGDAEVLRWAEIRATTDNRRCRYCGIPADDPQAGVACPSIGASDYEHRFVPRANTEPEEAP